MDAMLVFITDDFFQSAWTNQEIGFALGKGLPIIRLKLENQDPIGFIKDRQAIVGNLDAVENSASAVFDLLKKRFSKSALWRTLVVNRFCQAISFAIAGQSVSSLYELSELSQAEVDKIIEAFNSNSQLSGCWQLTRNSTFLDFLNKFSNRELTLKGERLELLSRDVDDEIPF